MKIIRMTVVQRLRMIYGKNVMFRLLFYLMISVMVLSVVLWVAEDLDNNPEYKSYGETLTNIFILFTSGFDVAKPQTLVGKFTAFAVLGMGICFVGLFTADVAAFLVERKMKGASGMKPVKASHHIVITRWSKETESIIDELMSDDLKERKPIVVIDKDVTSIPVENPYVEFVHGDPTESDVLERAGIPRADVAIILADPTSGDYNAEDSRQILITLAIESMQPDVYTCVQILNPANKKHLVRANANEIVCATEISTKVVVQSALNHGISELLAGLLTQGEGSEIYRIKLADRFIGKSYVDFQCDITRQHKFTLLALVRDGKFIVNPENEVQIQKGDEAFVMAPDHPEMLES